MLVLNHRVIARPGLETVQLLVQGITPDSSGPAMQVAVFRLSSPGSNDVETECKSLLALYYGYQSGFGVQKSAENFAEAIQLIQEQGLIPPKMTCPFRSRCLTAASGKCHHKGEEHHAEFSCSTARAYRMSFPLLIARSA